METVSVETISQTGDSNDCQKNPELSDKHKKRSGKKKRKSRKPENELKNNDSHISSQNGNTDGAFSSEEKKDGETEKSTGEDQVQLSKNRVSTLPAATLHHTDPILSTREDSLPDANRNGSSRKKSKRRERKKKEAASCEERMLDDAEKTTNEDQVHLLNYPLSTGIIQEGSREHTQESCDKPGAAQLCTDPNLSMRQDSQPDATTNMTSSPKKKRKKKRDRNALKESGVDVSTNAEIAVKYNTYSEAEGSKSMSVGEKTVASVLINNCLKSKVDTVEQHEGTDVKLSDTVSQTQSPKAKKRKKRKTKTMEAGDPLGNTLENNDGNSDRELMSYPASQRENSTTGEECGFQNLGKTKEKETDENTEVKENVLGAVVCDGRSKKRREKKKKTSTADMEVSDPSGSVECLLDHSNKDDMQNCDGNARQEFGGEDMKSKIEKSATREKSGLQKSGKRKEMTKDKNIESHQDALEAEGVTDVERKRQKRKRNKNTNCESIANADGEIARKDLASKIEDSVAKGESVQDVENTKKKKKERKGEVDQDTLGAEGVSQVEVKTKKSKKKKNLLDHKTDNMEEDSTKKNDKMGEVDQNALGAEGVSKVEVKAKKSKKKKNSLDHKTDVMEEKDDVSIPRKDGEREFDREKLETSLSSSVLIQNNMAQGVASSEIGDVPRCSCEGQRTRKLVVFDLNGILADIVQGFTGQFVPDGKVSYRSVFRRPFLPSFLDFCFERFDVAIWSSRRIGLDYMINIVMENYARNLFFCFDQSKCTTTKFKTQEKNDKPLFLKDLRRVWDSFGTCISCGKRKYDETNTLLVDDSPDKALCNPPHTGIFPLPYQYTDREDSALGPEGELRNYLERLADAENVQKFVAENPFGQTAITETHESWEFYSKVIEAHK